jgi:hypothetical protein
MEEVGCLYNRLAPIMCHPLAHHRGPALRAPRIRLVSSASAPRLSLAQSSPRPGACAVRTSADAAITVLIRSGDDVLTSTVRSTVAMGGCSVGIGAVPTGAGSISCFEDGNWTRRSFRQKIPSTRTDSTARPATATPAMAPGARPVGVGLNVLNRRLSIDGF